mmetsp:Transcript_17390/g.24665  ORF Transcript_17390/g.24665 Transcript_17390/m.24665 type:complete len:200 (-) Transcript_17390:288-887(-)
MTRARKRAVVKRRVKRRARRRLSRREAHVPTAAVLLPPPLPVVVDALPEAEEKMHLSRFIKIHPAVRMKRVRVKKKRVITKRRKLHPKRRQSVVSPPRRRPPPLIIVLEAMPLEEVVVGNHPVPPNRHLPPPPKGLPRRNRSNPIVLIPSWTLLKSMPPLLPKSRQPKSHRLVEESHLEESTAMSLDMNVRILLVGNKK